MSLINLLAKKTKQSTEQIEQTLKNASRKYKVFSIAKRGGVGYRVIAQPAHDLKVLQRGFIELYPRVSAVLRGGGAGIYRKGSGLRIVCRSEAAASLRSPRAAEAFRYPEAGNGGYVGVSGSVWKNAFWTPAGFRRGRKRAGRRSQGADTDVGGVVGEQQHLAAVFCRGGADIIPVVVRRRCSDGATGSEDDDAPGGTVRTVSENWVT